MPRGAEGAGLEIIGGTGDHGRLPPVWGVGSGGKQRGVGVGVGETGHGTSPQPCLLFGATNKGAGIIFFPGMSAWGQKLILPPVGWVNGQEGVEAFRSRPAALSANPCLHAVCLSDLSMF